jgi:hypothetical protein
MADQIIIPLLIAIVHSASRVCVINKIAPCVLLRTIYICDIPGQAASVCAAKCLINICDSMGL